MMQIIKVFIFFLLSVIFISCSSQSSIPDPDVEFRPVSPDDGVRLVQKIEFLEIAPEQPERSIIYYNEKGLIEKIETSVSFDAGQTWFLNQTIFHEYHDDERVKNTKYFGVDYETGEDILTRDIEYEYSVLDEIITTHANVFSTEPGSGGIITQRHEFNENGVLKYISTLDSRIEFFYDGIGNLQEEKSLEDNILNTRTLIPDYDNTSYNVLFKYGFFHHIPSILEPIGALSLRNFLVYEIWNTELTEPASVIRAEYEFNDKGYPASRRISFKNFGVDSETGIISIFTYEIVD